jgi:hypothetical protein
VELMTLGRVWGPRNVSTKRTMLLLPALIKSLVQLIANG